MDAIQQQANRDASSGEVLAMTFAHIERLKREYTDKFVVALDEQRPELRRFHGQTGQIKTINTNGRALVQFDGHNNVGWYDIELEFLKIVDAPPPKEDKKAARKPAAAGEAKKEVTPKPASTATAQEPSPAATQPAATIAPLPQPTTES